MEVITLHPLTVEQDYQLYKYMLNLYGYISGATDTRQSVPPFKLEVFCVLWECLHKCWADEVFLPALVHRFWKLTLQV